MSPRYAMSRVSAEPGGPETAPVAAAPDPAPDPVATTDAREAGAAAPAIGVAQPLQAEPEPVQTQATYRLLTMRGLAPAEAANLTAYLVGLNVHKTAWTLTQINRMLFLRQLYRTAEWGARERGEQ